MVHQIIHTCSIVENRSAYAYMDFCFIHTSSKSLLFPE